MKNHSFQRWEHLQFQYDHGDRPHVLEAAKLTLEAYNSGLPAIGHNLPPRSGKSSLIHVLGVELTCAGAPFVHAVTPWRNLADQLIDQDRVIANCKRLGFKGWTGCFVGNRIDAIESSRYWHRSSPRNRSQEPWTLITSTIHLVQQNINRFRDAVSLAVEESGGNRPVFIVDETHLLPETQQWAGALLTLQDAGAFIVTMTGTATRSDGACILGFRNEPLSEWDSVNQRVVIQRGEPYVRDADGLLVRDQTYKTMWGQERMVETKATGHTVGWDVAFENKWLHPVSAEPIDFKVVVDGDVTLLSKLDLKTADRGRTEWLRSVECCRALSQKAISELESWRSDHLTRHTKMLVITTQDTDFKASVAEKTANAHAREMRRQIMEAIATSPVLSQQGLTVEICTSVTEDGEADERAQLKLQRFGLTAPDAQGNTPIDILIVKTMGIVGLDVPECKIQIDASSIRRGPMKKQLATRPLTQWTLENGERLMREAVCIYPCDPRNHTFYQGLTETSEAAKEKQWEDSLTTVEQVEVKPPEPVPQLVDDSGRSAGYADEGGKWVEGDYDQLIRKIRGKYPATSVLRKIDLIELHNQGAFPLAIETVEPQAPADQQDDWDSRVINAAQRLKDLKAEESFGVKANRLASTVYHYGSNKEKWVRLVSVLQRKAKQHCRISPDLPADRIQDYEVVESLKAALDVIYNDAVTEVAKA